MKFQRNRDVKIDFGQYPDVSRVVISDCVESAIRIFGVVPEVVVAGCRASEVLCEPLRALELADASGVTLTLQGPR
eukprot:CAMPEP_0113667606 /NCGR_PEP_ID=MMETSP0038_2-20120614/3534_1 /TAXON_ID=2898 /ORGANISM="Cryptomonas paramecium" /LENGTH=75 /DNA_ID=CAMNT_0000583249 /DNA_START=224 /DNA_END=447 /DNA_ORIENTATION=+ /assembly_acc=CAM_ASM_000170